MGGRKGSAVSLASGKALLSLNISRPHPEILGSLEKQTQKLSGHLKYFISSQSAERLHGLGGFLIWNLSGPPVQVSKSLREPTFCLGSQMKTEGFYSFGEKGTLSDSLRSYRDSFPPLGAFPPGKQRFPSKRNCGS